MQNINCQRSKKKKIYNPYMKFIQNFSTHSYVLMRRLKPDTIQHHETLKCLMFQNMIQHMLHYTESVYRMGICSNDTPADHIRGLGTGIQEVVSHLMGISMYVPFLSCCAVHGHYADLQARPTLLPDHLNNLYLKLGITG